MTARTTEGRTPKQRVLMGMTAIALLGPVACNAILGIDDPTISTVADAGADAGTDDSMPITTCSSGTHKCEGAIPFDCTDGSFAAKPACASPSRCVAATGTCAAVACSPDEYRCTDNVLEKCNADQSAFVSSTACMVYETCNAHAKACLLCTSGEGFCQSGVPQLCDMTGQTFAPQPCAGSFVCAGSNKTCFDPTIPIGAPVGGLAVAPDDSFVYVSAGSSIKEIGTSTWAVTETIATLAGAGNLIISPDGKTLFVSYAYGHMSYEVTRIDVGTWTQTGHCPVDTTWGSDPLALGPAGTKLYAGLYPYGAITQIDVPAFTKTGKTYPADVYDNAIAVSPDGTQLWVGNHSGTATSSLRVIDVVTGNVSSLPFPDATVAFSFDAAHAYVRTTSLAGTASVVDINVATLAVGSTTPLGVNATGSIRITADGKQLVVSNMEVGNVMILDAASKAILKTVPVPSAYAVALSPSGTAYVGSGDNVVVVPLP